MGKQKLQKYPEWQDLICEYAKEFGMLEGATSVLPHKLSLKSIKRALNPETAKGEPNPLYIPEFEEKVKQALRDYKTMHTHPSEDPEFRRDVFSLMKEMAKTGRSSVTIYERDEQGRVLKKTFKMPSLDRWLYEVAYPTPKFTEETILVVIPNQIEYVMKREDLPDDIKILFQRIIYEFKDAAVEELQIRGLSTKHLN